MTMAQKYEEQNNQQPLTGHRNPLQIVIDHAKHIFGHQGSYGSNNDELAQILAVYDYAMKDLGWENNLSDIVSGYQASVDAKSHDDYKEVATIEELDRRMAMRRSMVNNNSQQQSGSASNA